MSINRFFFDRDFVLRNCWIFFILAVTCPYRPHPYNENDLETIVRPHLKRSQDELLALIVLNSKWELDPPPMFAYIKELMDNSKINILVMYGQFEEAKKLARFHLYIVKN